MPLWRGGPNTRTLPTVLLTPSASKAADMAHLCVPQNQALGVCRGFAPDIQICGTHGRKNLVNATIISNAEVEEELYMEALCELFADDTSLHNHHKNLDTLMNSLQHSVDNLISWTEMNHMALHPDKTKFMLVTTRQKRQNLLPNLPPLTIKSDIIQEVQNHKVLGITIDNNLSWTPHMNALCKKISTKVFQLSRLKHFVNFQVRKLFFTSHIQSLIDYGSTLWDSASQNTLKPLHSLHRGALKLILLKQSSLEKNDYSKLNVLPLHTRLKYNKGIFMKKNYGW